MRRSIAAIIAGLTLVACIAPYGIVRAADRSNILVMGEDADEHEAGAETVVVARDTRVFKQVLESISDELTQEGFDVFDERAVTLDTFKQNRTGRSEAELMDIARSIQKPPIDAAVIFTIYAGTRRFAYTTDLYARITGRILNVRTGQKLGSFEVTSPKGWKAPIGCERDCLLEVIGKNAETMAGDLGALIGQKLATVTYPNAGQSMANQNSGASDKDSATGAPAAGAPLASGLAGAYTLVFAGFSPDEITGVEEYLVAFKGYKLHRPVTTSAKSVQYWYEIDSDSARLNRNLRMMLDRIGTDGRITFTSTDNTFTVEKTPAPKSR